MVEFAIFLGVVLLGACIVLPVVAIVRTSRIRRLELRIAGIEAALLRLIEERGAFPAAPATTAPARAAEEGPPAAAEITPAAPVTTPAAAPPVVPPLPPRPSESLETIIGQKWIGWVSVLLILFATGFFLKYAFENRWIGELGRVALGVIAGLALTGAGMQRHRKGWRYLAQVLTAGGITILYLSVYGAFGYYHLLPQPAAFAFLVILVVEAHLLALAYHARSIAVMALLGGFLAPVLLSTGRDQYAVLFTYVVILDLGMLLAVMARRWKWMGSLAYLLTHLLFWGWYGEHYHPEKRMGVLLFQTVIFLLFLMVDLAPRFRRSLAGWEEWVRLAVNPFVFYATCYALLDQEFHDWMAPLALGLAIVYAAAARAELAIAPPDRRMLLVTVATALTFVTIAIPVQLDSNWITIAWALEAAALMWASFEAAAPPLRILSGLVFALALGRYVIDDVPWGYRAPFVPVVNRYYLGTLALSACLGAAAYLLRGATYDRWIRVAAALAAAGVLWLGSSVEAYSYFDSQATAITQRAPADAFETARSLRWSGQLALSVLWSVFAGMMTATGFKRQSGAWRVGGLVLFGLTLAKVVFIDISELRQFYRIVALLALGLILMVVAWAYQRGVRREQVTR